MELDKKINLVAIPPLLSQARFAELIGKEPKTIRSWVITKAIPTVKVGGSRMVNVEQLRNDLGGGKKSFIAGDYKND
ncbi:MAG: DNA-binding protein [Porticoccus sp.]|nr:DNA-binding protein [Porticoccus sp.]